VGSAADPPGRRPAAGALTNRHGAEAVIDFVAEGRPGQVTLHTVTYKLDEFQQALDDLDAGRVRGRAIPVP
jgi:D-arabinose 1-dehydrogenase-like Zn-dependent alcohol dehydrogenase